MRTLRVLVLVALVVAAGCASFRVDPERPGGGDALLSALEGGAAALSGGDPARAAELLDRAYWMDEDRQTRSISAGASALVTSDLALPYRPSATERALLHYYGARAWIALGRADEAAVEARRLSALLASMADNEDAFAPEMMATLHDVAAAVYAMAGDWNDAAVAARLRDQYRGAEAAPLCDSCGEVVVFAERGRVTHRVARSLTVAVADGDIAAVLAADDRDAGLAAAALAVDRAMSPRYCGWSRRAVCGWDRRRDRGGSFNVVRIAWPELAEPLRAGGTVVEVGGRRWEVGGGWEEGRGGNISESVAADFSRDAPARLARAVGRTVVRQAMVKAGNAAMERAKEDRKRNRDRNDDDNDNSTGWIVAGAAAYVLAGASTLAERADTRSWRSLPDELAVMRIPLPAGEHVVRQDGVAIADVSIPRGGIALVTLR
jgi:hypothetical protein